MANMGAVRDALIKLMGAKGDDVISRSMGPATVVSDDDLSTVVRTIGSPEETSQTLRGARQQAREVQGEDPLTQPLQPKEFHPDENQFEPPIPRTSPKDPSRLPDSEGALSRQEMNEAMEAEYSFLQKEFERLAGRPPTPDEVQDIGTLENLVDLLKDASGETRVPRASDLNPLADDIPF